MSKESRPADLEALRLCLIWAQDLNGAIGVRNALPWHAPEDLAHFKRTTQGHPVVMGRKTWESLPRKPLPGRRNLVVSHQPPACTDASVRWCASLGDALRAACDEQMPKTGLTSGAGRTVFVIGGAQLYAQALPWADEVHVTRVGLAVPDADAFAPELGPEWELVAPAFELNSNKGMKLAFELWKKRPTP